MKIQLKLLTVVFCLLLCTNLRAEENTLCTTATINETINSKYADNDKIKSLWAELQTKNIVKLRDSDANVRPQMVTIQSLVESSIASLLRHGKIRSAKAVIYTPLPPTPFRANDVNLKTLVKKNFYEDTNRMKTITDRIISTQQYLTSGGILYSLHKPITEESEVPGLDIYKNNINRYHNMLFDKPVKKIYSSYTGASYIAECQNGTKIFFAIKGNQAHNTRKKQWTLYYGQFDGNEKLNRYFKRVRNVYKRSADVPFDFQ